MTEAIELQKALQQSLEKIPEPIGKQPLDLSEVSFETFGGLPPSLQSNSPFEILGPEQMSRLQTEPFNEFIFGLKKIIDQSALTDFAKTYTLTLSALNYACGKPKKPKDSVAVYTLYQIVGLMRKDQATIFDKEGAAIIEQEAYGLRFTLEQRKELLLTGDIFNNREISEQVRLELLPWEEQIYKKYDIRMWPEEQNIQ